MKHELLAPAGSLEAGYAALHYGADAVYLGLTKFSARAGAENFTPEELDEFTAYAHTLGRKVFVALNTVLTEAEARELPEIFAVLRRTRVDALIVQDLGVFYLAKKMLPGMELHASTQMAVHNAEGAKFLQRLGFKRVVLARELSLREIQAVAEAAPDLDLEVFVHGALCYSYSGQCLFSALEYGKSANRGRCVYPCRAEFAVEEENDNRGAREDRYGLAGNCDAGRAGQRGETEGYGADGTDWYGLAGGCGGLRSHLFSMKDLALEEAVLKIPALSLKIEGRKKSPLYVAAVTNYYRHILDGRKKDLKEAEDIRQIFRGHGAGSILTARIKTWLTHILSGTGGCLSAKWNASGEIVWGLRLRMRWLVMTACRLTRQATKNRSGSGSRHCLSTESRRLRRRQGSMWNWNCRRSIRIWQPAHRFIWLHPRR